MARKTISLFMSFIALTFSSSMLYAQASTQDNQDNTQISNECMDAKKSQSEADIQKCLQGELTKKKDELIKKFKVIRPLNNQETAPQAGAPQPQNTTPAVVAPVQPITPVQPVVQPSQPPAPAQQAPRVNPYSY